MPRVRIVVDTKLKYKPLGTLFSAEQPLECVIRGSVWRVPLEQRVGRSDQMIRVEKLRASRPTCFQIQVRRPDANSARRLEAPHYDVSTPNRDGARGDILECDLPIGEARLRRRAGIPMKISRNVERRLATWYLFKVEGNQCPDSGGE